MENYKCLHKSRMDRDNVTVTDNFAENKFHQRLLNKYDKPLYLISSFNLPTINNSPSLS